MKEFFHNAARIIEADGFFTPCRFTEAQMAHYLGFSQASLIRARCTSGVTLEFITGAPSVSFDYRADAFSRPYVGFDFYEDGCLTKHIREPDNSPGGHIEYTRVREGESTVTVCISCLCEISLGSFQLGDARPTADPAPRLLFLGDSITQGMTSLCPSLIYPSLYARHCGAHSLNMGVGGAKFDATHLDGMPDFDPDHIFVAYGINDLFQSEDTAALLGKAEQFMERLRELYPGCGKTVITPIWNARLTSDDAFAARFALYCRELTGIAGMFGAQAVDGMKLVPHDDRHFFDGTHPNEQGFALYTLGLLDGKNRR